MIDINDLSAGDTIILDASSLPMKYRGARFIITEICCDYGLASTTTRIHCISEDGVLDIAFETHILKASVDSKVKAFIDSIEGIDEL